MDTYAARVAGVLIDYNASCLGNIGPAWTGDSMSRPALEDITYCLLTVFTNRRMPPGALTHQLSSVRWRTQLPLEAKRPVGGFL